MQSRRRAEFRVSEIVSIARVSSTYRERSRSVTSSCPASTAVQPHTLIFDNLKESPPSKSFGVGLSLDLQDIQWEQNDFSNSNQTRRHLASTTQ